MIITQWVTDADAVKRQGRLPSDYRSTVTYRRDKVAPLSAYENLL